MGKIFIGLGNPGEKYYFTRHNVGQIFLDWWAKKEGWEWKEKKDWLAWLAEGRGVILAKPLVFMNQSGEAVSCLKKKLRFSPDNLVIVHDELDLSLGEWKLTFAKSSPTHKGVLSIEEHLKTKSFWRLRIGIDNRDSQKRVGGEIYVLMKFSLNERKILENVFEKILKKGGFNE